MSLGFKATLFAGAITLGAFAPAFAAAPVISSLPDVTIGDLEDSTEATDNNIFVFSDAFTFSDFVTDDDTTPSELMWSFGEFSASSEGGLADSQYTINGVAAINSGDDEIAADEASGHANALNPGSAQINTAEDTATFRDIVLSPTGTTPPYPEPTAEQAALAAAGKVIRYYVSDGTNVDHFDAIIRTVDDAFDSTDTTYNALWEEQVRVGDEFAGWAQSGFNWEAVSISNNGSNLEIKVAPTQGRSRFFGWTNNAMLNYDEVGANRFVRGKFYLYTDVSVLEPVNQVPNFRLRVTHEGAVNAAAHFEIASTGFSDPGNEPFYGQLNDPDAEAFGGYWMRPADNGNQAEGNYSPTPSLYRIDLDPVDVPSAAGSNIGALIESYTVHDTADGSLFLTEVVLGTYNALDNSGNLVWNYRKDLGFGGGAGGAKVATGGGFNHEPSLKPGYLQDLYLEGQDPGGYFRITGNGAGDTSGVMGDTNAVTYDVFGIGLLHFESVNNADKLRIEPNTLYHARFYATAPVPSTSTNPGEETQGAIRFRFQTVADRVSYLLEMATLSISGLEGPGEAIAAEALPSTTSENPDQEAALNLEGEGGGWYSVVVASPLDHGGIRNDVETLYNTTDNTFFLLSGQPGSGSPEDSTRDVTLGVDLVQVPIDIEVGDPSGPIPLGRPNRAVARISAIEVYAYPSIDDGGFAIAPEGHHTHQPAPDANP